jgi:hypothetical protein
MSPKYGDGEVVRSMPLLISDLIARWRRGKITTERWSLHSTLEAIRKAVGSDHGLWAAAVEAARLGLLENLTSRDAFTCYCSVVEPLRPSTRREVGRLRRSLRANYEAFLEVDELSKEDALSALGDLAEWARKLSVAIEEEIDEVRDEVESWEEYSEAASEPQPQPKALAGSDADDAELDAMFSALLEHGSRQ